MSRRKSDADSWLSVDRRWQKKLTEQDEIVQTSSTGNNKQTALTRKRPKHIKRIWWHDANKYPKNLGLGESFSSWKVQSSAKTIITAFCCHNTWWLNASIHTGSHLILKYLQCHNSTIRISHWRIRPLSYLILALIFILSDIFIWSVILFRASQTHICSLCAFAVL